MEAHRIESAGKARENGTIDSSKHSHVKPPAKNPECEIANTPYLKVVGITGKLQGLNILRNPIAS